MDDADQAAADLADIATALDAIDTTQPITPDQARHTAQVIRLALADRARQAERVAELEANRDGWRRAFHEVRDERDQARARIAKLEAELKSMAAEKERFRRTIAIADDSCTCMAVFAARSKVRNDTTSSEEPTP